MDHGHIISFSDCLFMQYIILDHCSFGNNVLTIFMTNFQAKFPGSLFVCRKFGTKYDNFSFFKISFI